MEARIELQERTIAEMAQRHGANEATNAQIAEHVQRQDTFDEGVRASFISLAEEVGKHQNNFREVVRILQTHEEYMAKTGAVSKEIAQRINELIEENANKTVDQLVDERLSGKDAGPSAAPPWTSSPGRSDQESCEPTTTPSKQQQGSIGTSPTVTEVNEHDGDHLDFLGGQNHNTGPPTTGPVSANQIQQGPTGMSVVSRQF